MKRFTFFLVLLFLLFQHNAYSQIEKYLAAFTYQICKSTTWPAQSPDFVIGVIGESSVTPYLKQMTVEKKIGNSPISLMECNSAEEIGKCHVVFIAKNQTAKLTSVTEKLSGKPVLIITEESGTIKKGATVSFTLVDNKIRYELNKTAILRNNLTITGELERMALKIY